MDRRAFLRSTLAAAAWSVIGAGAAQPRPFRVGTTVSGAGRYAEFAAPIERALRLWVGLVDDASGFGGRGVSLRIRDDRSDPDRVRRAFEDLATEVDAFVAPYGSRLTAAAIPVAERAGVPLVAPSAGDRALWSPGRRWSAQILNPTDTMLASSLGLAAAHGLASTAFVHRDDPFSEMLFDGAERRATELGMDVASRRRFRDARGAREALGAVDADMLIAMGFRSGGAGSGFLEDARMLLAAIRRVAPVARWVHLGIAPADPAFGRAAGGAVDGIFGTTGWRSYLPTPGNAAFVGRYRSRWGQKPDTHAAQAYAAGEVLVRAYRREHTIDPAAVRDALFGIDAETVFGRYRVGTSGVQIGKVNAVVQWQGGGPRVVYPARYRTAPVQM